MHPSTLLLSVIGGSAFVVTVLTGTPALGGYSPSELFAWHAIPMVVALLLIMPLGLVVYSFDHPAYTRLFPTRAHRKKLHYGLQTAAVALILGAYAAAYVSHERSGKEHLAIHAKLFSRTVHVWTGLAVIGGLGYQALGGWAKVALGPRRRVFTQHSKLGLYFWMASLFPLVLAAYFRWYVKAGSSSLASLFLACVLSNPAAVYWWLNQQRDNAAPAPPNAAPSQSLQGDAAVRRFSPQQELPASEASNEPSSSAGAVVTRRSPAGAASHISATTANQSPLSAPGGGSGNDDEEERIALIKTAVATAPLNGPSLSS